MVQIASHCVKCAVGVFGGDEREDGLCPRCAADLLIDARLATLRASLENAEQLARSWEMLSENKQAEAFSLRTKISVADADLADLRAQIADAEERARIAEEESDRLRRCCTGYVRREEPHDHFTGEWDARWEECVQTAECERLHGESVEVGDRVVVAHRQDFDPKDAVAIGTLQCIEGAHYYIEGNSRGWRHCRVLVERAALSVGNGARE